jgi:hypothetical protein
MPCVADQPTDDALMLFRTQLIAEKRAALGLPVANYYPRFALGSPLRDNLMPIPSPNAAPNAEQCFAPRDQMAFDFDTPCMECETPNGVQGCRLKHVVLLSQHPPNSDPLTAVREALDEIPMPPIPCVTCGSTRPYPRTTVTAATNCNNPFCVVHLCLRPLGHSGCKHSLNNMEIEEALTDILAARAANAAPAYHLGQFAVHRGAQPANSITHPAVAAGATIGGAGYVAQNALSPHTRTFYAGANHNQFFSRVAAPPDRQEGNVLETYGRDREQG